MQETTGEAMASDKKRDWAATGSKSQDPAGAAITVHLDRHDTLTTVATRPMTGPNVDTAPILANTAVVGVTTTVQTEPTRVAGTDLLDSLSKIDTTST
jgi:hypothetical protein